MPAAQPLWEHGPWEEVPTGPLQDLGHLDKEPKVSLPLKYVLREDEVQALGGLSPWPLARGPTGRGHAGLPTGPVPDLTAVLPRTTRLTLPNARGLRVWWPVPVAGRAFLSLQPPPPSLPGSSATEVLVGHSVI